MEQKRAMSFLIENVKGKKKNIVALCLLQMFLGVGGVVQALLLRKGIDGAVRTEANVFWTAMVSFALLVFVQIACRFLLHHMEEDSKAGIENKLKQRLFKNLLSGEYAGVTVTHSGEWMTRLTSDTQIVADGMITILPGVAGMVLKLLSAMATLLVILPQFGWGVVLAGSVLLFFTYALRKQLKQLHRRVQEADERVRVFLQEHLGSLMLIKAYQAEERLGDSAGLLMAEHKRIRMNRNRLSNFCNTGFRFLIWAIYLFGAFVCGYGILVGTISYGTFVAVLQLIGQLQTPLAGMTGYGPKYFAMLTSAERLLEAEALHKEESVKEAERSVISLEFTNITFTYPDANCPTLQNMSMQIRKGEFIAFVGASGCGKSTLFKLLLGLYPVTEGKIQICFEDKSAELSEQYRSMFAYVPQGNHLMCGTVRDIVSFGAPGHKENIERMEHALRLACADFVFELENGVDTVLGENGAGLSEGQLQRLSIARAVFSGRKILLLDEATSALDEATERRFLKQLREQTDYTVLIVTHRPTALEFCDRVIDMEQFSHLKTEERQN